MKTSGVLPVASLFINLSLVATSTSGWAQTGDRPTCRVTEDWSYAVHPFTPSAQPDPRVRVWFERRQDLATADDLARALETEIWPALIDNLGLERPRDDIANSCNGGSGALDVYLTDFGFFSRYSHYSDYGGVTLNTFADCHQSPVYIMLDRDLPLNKLKAAVTHEFMHAVQWAYKTKACKTGYGWLLDATADWAIDYVYPSKNLERDQHAPWYMESPERSLDDRLKKDGQEGRDYGAYLFFQFLTKTVGSDVIRGVWQATVDLSSSLEAVNAAIPGGFAKQWPEFAKRLWNRAPIDTKPDSFKMWDTLSEAAALTLDASADLGGTSELKTELHTEFNNLSNTYYRFTFSDENTRSLLFFNGFFEQHKAGKDIKVLALWKDEAGAWQEEDWSDYEWIGLCRDLKSQRTMELAIIVSNGEYSPAGGKLTASKTPYLKRSNIGCWKYQGTATMLDKHSSWSGLGIRAQSNLIFELHPGLTGLEAKDPRIANSLRAGLSVALPHSGQDYAFELSYSAGCSFRAGPVSFPLSARGSLFTNPFPELKPTDSSLQSWLAQPSRAYAAAVADLQVVTVSVSGPGCHPTDTYMHGPILVTNDAENNVMINPPVARANGELTGNFKLFDATFEWTLRPQRQP